MNPYLSFVTQISQTAKGGRSLQLGGILQPPRPALAPNAPKALFFAPHPDDETISGGPAVRLLREAGINVINVAVTQGSNKARQAERWKELQAACDYLGFGLESTGPNGLERINAKTRNEDPAHWAACVKTILSLLQKHLPKVALFPHQADWNSTHIGTYLLVTDALKQMPMDYECFVIETEFWGQMANPNLMLELRAEDVADMIAATSFHVGEVQRNPYHLLLPAWMMDNVRRGTELVGGQGGAAPDFTFAVLNRFGRWKNGAMNKTYEGGKEISKAANIMELFS
jgi:LmbE family N-acetylglucosaminyl deacetylase